MNNMILDMAKSMLVGFDYIEIKTDEQKSQVEAFKAKVMRFAEGINDLGAFHLEYTNSGLQEKSMNLMSKIVMENTAGAQKESQTSSSSEDSSPLDRVVSVKTFVEQYRVPYEDVKKSHYKKRTEKAYEAILDVANQTDDMLDAQIILEDKRLLWNIVAEDLRETYETLSDATDPLFLHLKDQFTMYARGYQDAKNDGDISYITETFDYPRIAMSSREGIRLLTFQVFGSLISAFCANKIAIWEWKHIDYVSQAVSKICGIKKAISRYIKFLDATYNIGIDEIFSTESIKVYLQPMQYFDGMFRVKAFPHHQNFVAMKWILENEILSDKSLKEILLTEPKEVYYPAFELNLHFEQEPYFKEKIKEFNAHLLYFKYEDDPSFKRAEITQLQNDIKEKNKRKS